MPTSLNRPNLPELSEREWDRRLRIRTVGREDESDPNYSPYEPTPYGVLRRLAESGHITRKNHLLDYGCGKGRVAFFMAAVVGCRATGIDMSQKLIDIARENRRSSRLGDRVALKRCLAEQYEPEDEDFLFFFNPFSEKVFAGVLRRVANALKDRPRALTVACYYPSEAYVECLDETDILKPVDDIDCNDLFNGKQNPRERVIVYRAQADPAET